MKKGLVRQISVRCNYNRGWAAHNSLHPIFAKGLRNLSFALRIVRQMWLQYEVPLTLFDTDAPCKGDRPKYDGSWTYLKKVKDYA